MSMKLPFEKENGDMSAYYDPNVEPEDESGLSLMPGMEGREDLEKYAEEMNTGKRTWNTAFFNKSGRQLPGGGQINPRSLQIDKMTAPGPMDAKATKKMDINTFRKFITSEIRKAVSEESEASDSMILSGLENDDLDEASTTGGVSAFQAPLGMSREDLKDWGTRNNKKKTKKVGEAEFAIEIMKEIQALGLTKIETKKLFEAGLVGKIASRLSGGGAGVLGALKGALPDIKGSKSGLFNSLKGIWGDLKNIPNDQQRTLKTVAVNLEQASAILSELDDVLIETQEPFDHIVAIVSLLNDFRDSTSSFYLNMQLDTVELKNLLIAELNSIPESFTNSIETMARTVNDLSVKVQEEVRMRGKDEDASAGKMILNIFKADSEEEADPIIAVFNANYNIWWQSDEGDFNGDLQFVIEDEISKIKIANSPALDLNAFKKLMTTNEKEGQITVKKKK